MTFSGDRRKKTGGPSGWWLAALFWLAGLTPLWAQEAAEVGAFSAALGKFTDGLYEQAENEFAQFRQKFPESARLPDATLYQARAALEQQKLKTTIELLTAEVSKAALLADQYRYWLARAYMQSSNYLAAAESFEILVRDHPNSARLLEASYGEAKARSKLRDWPRVLDLLQSPRGTFQQAARERANDELVVSGYLLLAEAALELRELERAEEAIRHLAEDDLVAEFKWRRQYLLCRIQLADQRLTDALSSTTNLIRLASDSGKPNFQAESIAMQGGILGQLGRFAAATNVYEGNLQESAPAEYRRLAVLHIIELMLEQNTIPEAAQRLEAFFAKYPEDLASDVALLTLGEIQLKQHLAEPATNRVPSGVTTPPAGTTNHLQQALVFFERLARECTNSPLLAKARLNHGWCLWNDGHIAESQADFQAAAEQLPFSEDQAVARFKLADAQFLQKDFTNALQNYRTVLNQFSDLPRVRNTLFDHALYQILRASIKLNDLAAASEAVQRILRSHPGSFFSDRSVLLLGQSLTEADQPGQARELLAGFARNFPQSSLRPKVELAVAQTYFQAGDWTGALSHYEEWLERYPTNDLLPRARFDYARATARSGQETNALILFTNFVAQFATDDLAPVAKYWVADFYFGEKDWINAERNYQELFENWPASELNFQARMMAGRAASARQSYSNAREHFVKLINTLLKTTNTPPELLATAYFALGDCSYEQFRTDPAKSADTFRDAINAFTQIIQDFPTNRQASLAWGRMGDCYLQLAGLTQDAKNYESATNAYEQAMLSRHADTGTRSQAEVGLAIALEKMAEKKTGSEQSQLLSAALSHYTNLVYGNNLREDEKPDPVWLKEAGLAAARLVEAQKQWAVAIKLYHRLGDMIGPLRPMLEVKIEKAREQLRLEKN